MQKITKSEEEWRSELTEEEYGIIRLKGTEPAFSGAYYQTREDGVYHCRACDAPLFTSDTKYESGSGWPSFWEPISEEAIEYEVDNSHGMERTEITCARCGAHLGHVFEDGPQPSGERYCVNSLSLNLKED